MKPLRGENDRMCMRIRSMKEVGVGVGVKRDVL